MIKDILNWRCLHRRLILKSTYYCLVLLILLAESKKYGIRFSYTSELIFWEYRRNSASSPNKLTSTLISTKAEYIHLQTRLLAFMPDILQVLRRRLAKGEWWASERRRAVGYNVSQRRRKRSRGFQIHLSVLVNSLYERNGYLMRDT